MRSEPTDAERALWHLLRAKRFVGYKFKRQVPIDRYIVDFVCFADRLIIEADGSQHAESNYDAERDAYLAEQGFRVLRFWNNDILANTEGVSEVIWAALQDDKSTPSPQPLSRKGRGAFEGAHNG
nr:endonuclease domain-containing protein [Sphingopyxis sp.]